MKLTVQKKSWPLREPFVIARATYTNSDVIVVQLQDGSLIGRGEAAGVDYHGETPDGMLAQLEAVRARIEAGITRAELLKVLPIGGARNAVDAALWDLEAKRSGRRVWELAGVGNEREIASAVTIGIRSVEEYEKTARELAQYRWLKIKVNKEQPLECVRAVRRGAPNSRLIVDANQAWDVKTLYALGPRLAELRVDLLEQPVPVDGDDELVAGQSPIPVCADEAIDTIADLERLKSRYEFVNIKLDKTGGLTAALELANAARAQGMRLMVGCMVTGSIGMAPGMVLAQLCEVVDLDGPLLQAADWPDAIQYDSTGVMSWPSASLWG
ncbi:dipeptide epimerase [Steroidobacter sp. S1-65]|uniref:Dipeptide epimerase n=1 Tax=Steroidobacter gossypii TaxID=2805490 RepID=A0ABS1X1T7_9GAMM|nr:N-acetyl-D-Glu racemase DgcA [Steroidobacter gossypii]MBM0107200.1 dipeptide epimerase [Steroidobacter gossypii]